MIFWFLSQFIFSHMGTEHSLITHPTEWRSRGSIPSHKDDQHSATVKTYLNEIILNEIIYYKL